MKLRRVGKTDIEVSEIGLGCWAIGGPNYENGTIPSGWSPIDRREVKEAIAYALDHGVTHFDTADVYGNGQADRLLAEGLGTRTKDVVISSKVGYFQGCAEHGYDPLQISHQCEMSLQNLKRDTIDIYYFHHSNFGKGDAYLDDALAEMCRLQEQGKIRAIGLSTYSQKAFKRLIPKIKPDVVQCWVHMMDYHFVQKGSPLQQLCDRYGCSVIGFQPLNQGILMDKYDYRTPPVFGEGDHRASLEKFKESYLKRAADGLAIVKERFGSEPEQLSRAALQFVLYHKQVTSVIPGFRNRQQVKQLLKLANSALNGDDVATIYRAFQA